MYKLTTDKNPTDGSAVEGFYIKRDDGAWIPKDPDNTDYQQYLKWLEEGNTPEPAEEQQ
jgi:hypothetical protein